MGIYERFDRTGKILLFAAVVLVSLCAPLLLPGLQIHGAGTAKQAKMKVEFLYAIEGVGGRGDRFQAPRDLSWDSKAQELYIADAGRGSIVIFDPNGVLIEEMRVDRELGSPTLVATDGAGRIYIGYNRSKKITVFDFRGDLLGSYDLPGIVDMPGSKIRPMYLATGPDGHVYTLKSSGGVVEIDPFGEKHRQVLLEGEDAPATIYGFDIDRGGRFLFTDMRPASVVAYDPKDQIFHRFGKPGVVYGQLSRPQGVASDDHGRIFVTSSVRNRVLCYDKDGNFIEEFGRIGKGYGQFYMPEEIASDGANRLFVLEPALRRIQVFRVTFPGEKSTGDSSETNELSGEAAEGFQMAPGT